MDILERKNDPNEDPEELEKAMKDIVLGAGAARRDKWIKVGLITASGLVLGTEEALEKRMEDRLAVVLKANDKVIVDLAFII
jgi:hypothetical protein